MKFKQAIAAGMCMSLLMLLLNSCGDGERVQATLPEESDTVVDTAEVELSEDASSAAMKRLQELLTVTEDSDAKHFVTEIENGAVRITGYAGGESTVKVPETIDGFPVTAIGDGAFSGNAVLQVLILPSGVRELGSGILNGCTSLVALETPLLGHDAQSEQYLGYLFGSSSFSDNARDVPSSLQYLRLIGDGESLGAYALYDCNDLIGVELPDQMKTIEKFALYNCASLCMLSGVERLTAVKEYGMAYCKSLTSLRFGSALTALEFSSLEGCTALRILALPFVGDGTEEHTHLGYIFGAQYPDFAKGYYPVRLERVELLEPCRSIGNYAFYECTSLKELVIPNGVNSIGVRAFYKCTSLWKAELPSSLVTIREGAFYGCGSLLSVSFEEGLTTVGINAFYGCDSLKNLCLPHSLNVLPASCFAGCRSLVGIDLGGVTEVGAQAFRHCTAVVSVHANGDVVFGIGNETVERLLYPED